MKSDVVLTRPAITGQNVRLQIGGTRSARSRDAWSACFMRVLAANIHYVQLELWFIDIDSQNHVSSAAKTIVSPMEEKPEWHGRYHRRR